ncbi:methylated-DNA--[protein]-cysteine S-methyltransferase [Streptantibioticus silvisoli]|uniref:Methylated-DNA--protein-cysteine methyltransferase n=1 Tax=Streptantibioticus silvisoli TaxID=2705255 RepID=A0ABT6VXE3_9ACTN|nr:methylated-DNA--[protein]-cysteine S-methyltransferase [Streptantibioticus silvisoli]MDI5963163.1 methylated-DNA--[protein]-cysteine S-methyltransferase [Streptantibioticus silvisoli]
MTTSATAPGGGTPAAEPPAQRQPAGGTTVRWTVLDDMPIGPLLVAATPQGLVKVEFRAGERAVRSVLGRLAARFGTEPVRDDAPAPDSVLGRAAAELRAYFAGTLRDFTVPLDWSLSGGFNLRVLLELAASVPYGGVVGYQTLADRVGEPGAARAVGVAMGSNPLPVVVACHRVVESNGNLGGFGGGLPIKRQLLALEGVLPEPLF